MAVSAALRLTLLAALLVAVRAFAADADPAASSTPPARFADAARRDKLLAALPRVQAYMADRFADVGTPGMAYAVVIDGEVVLARGLGLRDVPTAAPVDGDTVFRIASMTKSFTALAIVKLRDAGKLALDDPVALHVPELAAWQPATRDAAPITIRHLLAHTAGLPEDNPSGDRTLALGAGAFSDWLRRGVPFASATGSSFEYSNLGFMLLGRVVSHAAGRPYQDYITDEILRPLGMTATHWSAAKVPLQRLAKGYRKEGNAWVAEPMLEDGAGGAMGGLMSSANDMARFIAMMLAAYPPRDDAEQLPALRSSLREMQSGLGFPALDVRRRSAGAPLIARGTSYGYGLFSHVDCRWGREVEHSGGLPGFESDMRWLPEHGVGIVVLTNSVGGGTWRSGYEALALLQNTGALLPREAQAAPALVRAAQATTELILDWRDDRARALAADNLFLDESMASRRSSIQSLRSGLGRCTLGRIQAQNALRGTFRVDCDKGWLDAFISLSPTSPPRVQALTVTAGRPLGSDLQAAALAAVAAIAKGPAELRLAPKARRADVAALLETTRQSHGACTLGDTVESDGTGKATVALDCDRGRLHLTLALDATRIASVDVKPADRAACVP